MMQQGDRQRKVHFHIRWPEKLDWERFESEAEAAARAEEIVRPDETYSIEPFNGDCPACGELIRRFAGAQAD